MREHNAIKVAKKAAPCIESGVAGDDVRNAGNDEEESMMRGYKYGLLLMMLPYWVPMAVADQAVSGVAASAVGAVPSPEEDYQAGLKAYEKDDTVDAIRLFYRAAESGHAGAQAEMGYILRQGSNYKPAFEYYRKSAAQGNATGQYGLGMMYAAPGEYQDFAEARKWVILAADQGDELAIYEMARSYIKGGLGLDENARKDPEALNWIKRSADIKDLSAIIALADAYRSGKYGLKIDEKQAKEWDDKYKEITGLKEVPKKTTKRR